METSQHPLHKAKPHCLKLVVILSSCLLFAVLGTFAYQQWQAAQRIDVCVNVDGAVLETQTTMRQVDAVLAELEIELSPKDVCYPALDVEFDQPITITVERAIPIMLELEGQRRTVWTTSDTVRDVLSELRIPLGNDDRVEPELFTEVRSGMDIAVTRIQRFNVAIDHELPFTVVRNETSDMTAGFEKTVQYGQPGLAQEVFEVILEDGIEVERISQGQIVLTSAVNEIVHVGTAGVAVFDETSFPYARMYYMETTGYCSCYLCCGKHPGDRGYGITMSGLPAGRGVVGADLNVFPLGTRLYVEGYGYCVVGDTGGGIIGRNRVDLGFVTHEEAVAWALRHNMAVYVLEE